MKLSLFLVIPMSLMWTLQIVAIAFLIVLTPSRCSPSFLIYLHVFPILCMLSLNSFDSVCYVIYSCMVQCMPFKLTWGLLLCEDLSPQSLPANFYVTPPCSLTLKPTLWVAPPDTLRSMITLFLKWLPLPFVTSKSTMKGCPCSPFCFHNAQSEELAVVHMAEDHMFRVPTVALMYNQSANSLPFLNHLFLNHLSYMTPSQLLQPHRRSVYSCGQAWAVNQPLPPLSHPFNPSYMQGHKLFLALLILFTLSSSPSPPSFSLQPMQPYPTHLTATIFSSRASKFVDACTCSDICRAETKGGSRYDPCIYRLVDDLFDPHANIFGRLQGEMRYSRNSSKWAWGDLVTPISRSPL